MARVASVSRFCPACGARLPAPPPVTCAVCGRTEWRNAKPAAGGIVLRDDAVLLVRRAHAPWRDMWSAHAGFCDGLEHPIAAAEREVFEETGVRAQVTGFLGIWTDCYADEPADDEDVELISVVYYYATPLDDGSGTPDPGEVAEARWFRWHELPAALAPPGTLERVLAAAREARESGATETPLPDRPA
jgi:ADP-ribose pyrophosphatase YjhB (NUDIX family)